MKKPLLDHLALLNKIGKHKALEVLDQMLLIRNFEVRAESAYLSGKVGGFFHSYAGEEAIQTSITNVFGKNHWYIGFYRCHALALLLGATPNELMAELYGKKTGNAKGRGGSMHLYTETLLGGFAIVGGQMPIAIGAAFSNQYLKQEGKLAICFMGEGAVAQGAFHEAMNMAALWSLPCLFVIENNQWGMGTHVSRAIAASPIAEKQAASYGIKGYALNGMDYLECVDGFEKIQQEIIQTRRPILVECLCERFRGHSISDPALYRTKEESAKNRLKDPIAAYQRNLEEVGWIDEETFKQQDKKQKECVLAAMDYAEKSAYPSLTELEEGVYAP